MPRHSRSGRLLLLVALFTWGCASTPSNWAPADLGPAGPCDLTRLVEPGNRVEIQHFDGSRVTGWVDEVQPDALFVNDTWYGLSTMRSLQVANASTTWVGIDVLAVAVLVAAIVLALANMQFTAATD